MRELMILSALSKKDQIEIKFHPDAPVDAEKLAALANANRKTMRLTPSYQVLVTISPGEYEQVLAQIDGILQALAACEKFDSQAARPAGPLAN
jgi:transcription-repair coupling factor (superfamily II helicase)